MLHAWLNTLRMSQQIAYSYNARHSFPSAVPIRGPGNVKNDQQSEAVKIARATFIDKAKNGPLNLTLDTPNACGAGGNSDTGM